MDEDVRLPSANPNGQILPTKLRYCFGDVWCGQVLYYIFFSLQSTATTSYIVITSDGGWIWTLAGFGGIKTFTECRNSLERHVSHETLNWHYFSGVWAMARVIRPHWRMPISINFGGKYNLGGCQVKFYCLLLSIYFFCHRCAAGKRLVWPYIPPPSPTNVIYF